MNRFVYNLVYKVFFNYLIGNEIFIYLDFNTFFTLLILFYKVGKLLIIIKIKDLVFDILYIITSVIYIFFVTIEVIIAINVIIAIISLRKFNLI